MSREVQLCRSPSCFSPLAQAPSLPATKQDCSFSAECRCCSDQRDSLPRRLRLLGASQPHTTSNLPYSTRVNFVSLFVFVKEPHLCQRVCVSDKPCACRYLCGAAGCLAKHLRHNTAVVPVTAGNWLICTYLDYRSSHTVCAERKTVEC